MAGRKKKAPPRRRGRGGWIALGVIGAVVIALAGLAGYGAVNANTVHVRRAEVSLDDLPGSFDGCRVLFVSDIDICGMNTPEKSAALFDELQALEPDVLLLGGDYTSTSVMDILNQTENKSKAKEAREDFFRMIADFEAPMGKFSVSGDNDADGEELAHLMKTADITPLFNDHAALQSGGSTVHLVGFSHNAAGVNFNGVASAFEHDDCVIALTHSPGLFPQIVTAEASDNGPWADLILAGHTHGGQIRLFDRNIIQLTPQEQSFLKGWKQQGENLMLVSSGLGCEGANLRLGSDSEVWLITLRRPGGGLPDLLD